MNSVIFYVLKLLMVSIVAFFSYSCSVDNRYSTDKRARARSRYYRTQRRPEVIEPSGELYQAGRTYHWVSSYYGAKFHGRKTANGEIYDMSAMTCAHRELPFGTELLVTNPRTQESVRVRVNDRGPFVRGRDLDLSQGAATRVGLLEKGVKKLEVEILLLPSE